MQGVWPCCSSSLDCSSSRCLCSWLFTSSRSQFKCHWVREDKQVTLNHNTSFYHLHEVSIYRNTLFIYHLPLSLKGSSKRASPFSLSIFNVQTCGWNISKFLTSIYWICMCIWGKFKIIWTWWLTKCDWQCKWNMKVSWLFNLGHWDKK